MTSCTLVWSIVHVLQAIEFLTFSYIQGLSLHKHKKTIPSLQFWYALILSKIFYFVNFSIFQSQVLNLRECLIHNSAVCIRFRETIQREKPSFLYHQIVK